MRGYAILPRAETDLRQIWSFSFSQWGRAQADRYIGAMEARFAAIAEDPDIGKQCDDTLPGLFRIASGSHVIFYRKGEALVSVIRILHKRRDFSRHLTPPP